MDSAEVFTIEKSDKHYLDQVVKVSVNSDVRLMVYMVGRSRGASGDTMYIMWKPGPNDLKQKLKKSE
jgi:hypothetical protein